MSAVAFPQPELARVAKLSLTDLEWTQQCCHLYTCLGFIYQLVYMLGLFFTTRNSTGTYHDKR
jgi:hypothetical protein